MGRPAVVDLPNRLSSLEAIIEKIGARVIHNVSTGGIVNRARYLCPHCSAKYGREIGFHDRDQLNRYICSHDNPSFAKNAEPGIEYDFSDYSEINGLYDFVEISLVLRACLDAHIVR